MASDSGPASDSADGWASMSSRARATSRIVGGGPGVAELRPSGNDGCSRDLNSGIWDSRSQAGVERIATQWLRVDHWGRQRRAEVVALDKPLVRAAGCGTAGCLRRCRTSSAGLRGPFRWSAAHCIGWAYGSTAGRGGLGRDPALHGDGGQEGDQSGRGCRPVDRQPRPVWFLEGGLTSGEGP